MQGRSMLVEKYTQLFKMLILQKHINVMSTCIKHVLYSASEAIWQKIVFINTKQSFVFICYSYVCIPVHVICFHGQLGSTLHYTFYICTITIFMFCFSNYMAVTQAWPLKRHPEIQVEEDPAEYSQVWLEPLTHRSRAAIAPHMKVFAL